MNANFLLEADAVRVVAEGSVMSKKEILARLAACFSQVYGVDENTVRKGLEAREKLGSTGFGCSVAMPHTRYDGLKRSVSVLLRLPEPIDFAAADAMKVDLVFALLSPTDTGAAHLHALAAMSRMVRDDQLFDRLLAAESSDALFAVMTNAGERNVA